MHHRRDAAAQLSLDWDDITTITLRDQVLLRDPVGDRAAQDRFQRALQTLAQMLGLLSGVGEFGAGAVKHLAALVERVLDLPQQRCEVGDPARDPGSAAAVRD